MMKIVHVCLAAFYVDNYSYQENILPRYHKKLGNEVSIIASLETYSESGELTYLSSPVSYLNEDEIPVFRIGYSNIPFKKKLRKYNGYYNLLEKINPDIIFMHGPQTFELINTKKFKNKYPDTKIIVDNHASSLNSANSFFSKYILHRFYYNLINKMAEKSIDKYFAVTPQCKNFLIDNYKINDEKIDMLYLGYEETNLSFSEIENKRSSVRKKYNIDSQSIVLITGGKITPNKKLDYVIDVFDNIESPNVKLIVFGTFTNDSKNLESKLKSDSDVILLGWQSSEEINELLIAADIAFFPGSQSVIWQQAIGSGLVLIVAEEEDVQYLDSGGNVVFVSRESIEDGVKKIDSLINNKKRLNNLKQISKTLGKQKFSYSNIADKSIKL